MGRAEARAAGSYALGLGATLAVLLPAALPGARDSFPLSTYPMFSRPRPHLALHAVVGTTLAGERRPLPPALYASGEVLQTRALVERAVRDGRRGVAELCRHAATRAGGSTEGYAGVEIQRQTYDPVAYYTDRAEPISVTTLTRCPVPRAGARRSGVR